MTTYDPRPFTILSDQVADAQLKDNRHQNGQDDQWDDLVYGHDESFQNETNEAYTLKSEFTQIMDNIKDRSNLPSDDIMYRWETIFKRLNEKCSWLPGLVVKIPKSQQGFQMFESFLEHLLRVCQDFPNWKDEHHGETILHIAVRESHKPLILYIWKNSDQGKKGLKTKSINDLTCLHIAVQREEQDPLLVNLILRLVGNSAAVTPGPGGNTPLHLAVDVKRCQSGGKPKQIVEILLQASAESITTKNDQGLTPLQYHYKTRMTPGYNRTGNVTVNEIEALLKLNCLRLDLKREETWEILYGSQMPPRELSLDLFGYEEIRADDLKNLAGHLSFESTLKSVALPDLTVQPPESYMAAKKAASKQANKPAGAPVDHPPNSLSNNPSNDFSNNPFDKPGDEAPQEPQPPDCPGRIDYCWIFRWLRSQKVTKILRVAVDDRRHISHSDESIEWCLSEMGVEIWDWNKLDICCTAIMSAAPGVRNLTLYCSGNNAVLRSWTAPHGIAELKDLEVVTLKILQGLESLTRTTDHAEAFKKCMEEQRRQWCHAQHEKNTNLPPDKPCPNHEIDVKWHVVGSDGRSIKANSENDDDKRAEAEKQEWLLCMEKFAEFIRAYRETVAEAQPDVKKRPPPVKVALIDDGVDGLNAELSCIVEAGRSFSERSKHDYNSYFTSSKGHGTIMAMLIRKICPNARLYVAKLNEEKTGRNTMSITASSAVEAVLWAISHRVDIISMSWTINMTNENAAAMAQLQTAINTAVEKQIIIFCSVSDQGAQDTGLYPANCNRSNSFLIGTATIAGQAWKWNGANDVDYILPGTDLEVKTGDELFDRRLQKLCDSGSSLATALAAGLAGLILDCVSLNNAKELRYVKHHNGMQKAFNAINMKSYSDKYLRVWDTFGQALKEERKFEGQILRSVVNRLLINARNDAVADPQKTNPGQTESSRIK